MTQKKPRPVEPGQQPAQPEYPRPAGYLTNIGFSLKNAPWPRCPARQRALAPLLFIGQARIGVYAANLDQHNVLANEVENRRPHPRHLHRHVLRRLARTLARLFLPLRA